MAKKETDKKYSPRELMELTFEESLASVGEHVDKPDPLVGAILATSDGRILARAHRGELREGEHCEFTLIERKLRQNSLKGCVLYVTLEPCIDKARTPPKRGCATHIKKARISKVYIGMRDPDVDIENQGVNELIEAGIEVEDFPFDLNEKIRISLKDFIQYKEEQKLVSKKDAIEPEPFLGKLVGDATTIDEFSKESIETFIRNSNAEFVYPSNEFNRWLVSFNLAKESNNRLIPTNLGMLLFGEEVEHLIPHSVFNVELDFGDGKREVKTFGGPISTQLSNVFDYVKSKGLRLTIDRTSAKRTVIEEFPHDVLREVIANAIIHRDYSIDSASNSIYLSPSKIIVRSPGLPVPPLTIEDVRTMDIPSISRNPKIMYVYNRMGMAESRGIGLRSLKSLPSKGFPLPIFKMIGVVLEITFMRKMVALPEVLGIEDQELSSIDERGLLFIQTNSPISVSDYAKEFGVSTKTAQRRLAVLVDKGLVIQIGERRYTRYVLKN
ncbi:MAG: deaminase [Saprospiraceae bacterium]